MALPADLDFHVHFREGRFKAAFNVFEVFAADGETDEVVGDAGLFPFGSIHTGVGHGGRVLHKGLDTAQRDWVLSLPYALRYRMAYDADLTGDVLRIFVRRVFASMKRRARAQWGIKDPQCGTVTFVQRFSGALNLNVHFHTLVLDGVFDPAREMQFRRLPPPDDGEVVSIVRTTAGGILRMLERRGLGADADPDQADPVTRDEGLMAALYSASVRGRIATGPRDGQEVMRFGDYVEVERMATASATRCINIDGLSLHAPAARHRTDVVPVVEKSEDLESVETNADARSRGSEDEKAETRPRNYSWTELMRRVFAIDVLQCRSPPSAPPDPRDSYNDSYYDVC